MYARWFAPHPSTKSKWSVGYSDATAHRIISDLSAFIGNADPSTHRILAAGDLNLIYGSNTAIRRSWKREGPACSTEWRPSASNWSATVPGGEKGHAHPRYLPPNTSNVPTYHTVKERPATASRQLDYVFASRGFHERVRVRALNEVDEWGPSDHCRVMIEVD